MAWINTAGYIVRKSIGGYRKPNKSKATTRDWWLIKYGGPNRSSPVNIGQISIPKEYIGRRIKFKLEVLKDE